MLIGCAVDTMYEEFLTHPRMTAVRGRAVWIHCDVPGQGKHQQDLPPEYVQQTLSQSSRCDTVIHIGYDRFLGVVVAARLGRRTFDQAVVGSITGLDVIRHLGQLILPPLPGR